MSGKGFEEGEGFQKRRGIVIISFVNEDFKLLNNYLMGVVLRAVLHAAPCFSRGCSLFRVDLVLVAESTVALARTCVVKGCHDVD